MRGSRAEVTTATARGLLRFQDFFRIDGASPPSLPVQRNVLSLLERKFRETNG